MLGGVGIPCCAPNKRTCSSHNFFEPHLVRAAPSSTSTLHLRCAILVHTHLHVTEFPRQQITKNNSLSLRGVLSTSHSLVLSIFRTGYASVRAGGRRPRCTRSGPASAGGVAVASDSHAIAFVKCRAWATQIRELWRSVGGACEWKRPRAPSIRLLFQDKHATPAALAFLRDTKIGRMITLAPPEEEWGELKEISIELRPDGEEGNEHEEEAGPIIAHHETAPSLCLL